MSDDLLLLFENAQNLLKKVRHTKQQIKQRSKLLRDLPHNYEQLKQKLVLQSGQPSATQLIQCWKKKNHFENLLLEHLSFIQNKLQEVSQFEQQMDQLSNHICLLEHRSTVFSQHNLSDEQLISNPFC